MTPPPNELKITKMRLSRTDVLPSKELLAYVNTTHNCDTAIVILEMFPDTTVIMEILGLRSKVLHAEGFLHGEGDWKPKSRKSRERQFTQVQRGAIIDGS